MIVWAYFRLPETKGRSYEELSILFAQKVSARKFASIDVDAFDERQNAELPSRAQSVAESTGRKGSGVSAIARVGRKL